MSFDPRRAAKASETTFTFEPVYPDGTPIGATITVRGPESAKVRDVLRRQLSRLQERELQAKRRGKAAPEETTIEELEAQAIDLAVAYTVGWAGVAVDGEDLPADDANVRKLYADHAWIRRQVIDEAQELGNFIRPPSASSSPTPQPSSAST